MTSDISGDQALITLGEIAGAIRRQWKIILVFVLLGLLAAALVIGRSGSFYTAESQLVIDPITTDPFAANSRPIDAVSPTTERSVLLGSAVATEVIKRLNLDTTPSDLLSRVTAENPEGSLTLSVSASAASAERAQQLADTFAEVYLEQRGGNASNSIDSVVDEIDKELAATGQQLADLSASSADLPPLSFEAQQAEAQISTLRSRIASLETRRTDLLSAQRTPGRITRDADLPQSPDGLPPLVLGAGIVLVFGTLGVVVAIAFDRRKGLIHDVSVLEAGAPSARVHLATSKEDVSAAVGAIAFDVDLLPSKPPTVLMSSIDREGSRQLTDELASAFSRSGRRVLGIWTGDRLRRPTGGLLAEGLERVCDGSAYQLSPADLRRQGPLWLIPAAGAGSAALARDDVVSRVSEWATANHFDIVLVSTLSPRLQPAVASFARRVDEVVLGTEGLPHREALSSALTVLGSAGVAVRHLVVDASGGEEESHAPVTGDDGEPDAEPAQDAAAERYLPDNAGAGSVRKLPGSHTPDEAPEGAGRWASGR